MANLSKIGNYQLLEELSFGAYGRVYRAEHAFLKNRVVAVKLLHSTHLLSKKERESFMREARVLELLKHPLILQIIDIGVYDGSPYLVTEFAAGGSLRMRIGKALPGLLPFEEIKKILRQVAQALHFAHQHNIIHRDLKPENILFNAQGDALLADFGLSAVLNATSMQQVSLAGTPGYMAPEQFRGTISRESDQYALGCIAYELFTGRQPFTAPDIFSVAVKHMSEAPVPPMRINPLIPEQISQAILKAMEKRRSERYSDILNFATALEKDAREWMNDGSKLFVEKRYEEALACYEQALQLDPRSALAHHNKGAVLGSLKRYEEALKCYNQTLLLDPYYVLAHNNKGDMLRKLGRHEEALASYKEAIRLDPKYALAYYNKALALEALERYEEAVTSYEEAMQRHVIRLDRNYALAYLKKGFALRSMKRYEEALDAYEQAIRIDPASLRAYNGKALVLRRLGRYEEALLCYEQVLRRDPALVLTLLGKGITLKLLQRDQEAQTLFQSVVNLDPGFAFTYTSSDIPLETITRYEASLAAFEQTLEVDLNTGAHKIYGLQPPFQSHKD